MKRIKRGKIIATAIMIAMAVSIVSTQALTLNFANLSGAAIVFSGSSSFGFSVNPSGYSFDITGEQNGTGSAAGLNGDFSANAATPFVIGAISSPVTGIQTASVTGSGTLSISDGSSTLFGMIQWNDITTFYGSGVLNLNGQLNLTGITYSGSNPDLMALASGGSASDTITFQFNPAQSLSQLATTAEQTSYSGSIYTTAVPVPEPGTLTLAGAGLLGLLSFSRLRKRQ